jgi:hypothetical protein
MAISGTRSLGACGRLIGSIEGNRRRILMHPWRGDGIGRKRVESDGPKDTVEIGGEKSIQNLS